MEPLKALPDTAAGVYRTFREGLLACRAAVAGGRIVAACSGGPDSVALVSLLLRLRREVPVDVVIAHFDHRLRADSAADEAFVRELAGRRGLPIAAGSADVRAFAADSKMNLEEAGRVLRYRFLRDQARRLKAAAIATGHTMNDQAETFLMRLMRGAGIAGLAGIAPVREGEGCPVIRPLLGLTRARLLAYLEAEGETFRTDATNRDRRNLRNRIRLDLIPDLERRYEPRIVEHLARLASIAREEDELLSEFVGELGRVFILRRGRDVLLNADGLPDRLPALSRRLLREFIREVRGDLRSISFDDVASVLRLADGRRRALPGGPTLVREKGWIKVHLRPSVPRAFRLTWDGRGPLDVAAAGMRFHGRWRKAAARVALRKDDRRGAALDASKLAFPLVVRGRRPGDLYRPLGAPGRKKLKEILRAKGVDAEARDRLPVFVSGREIVWVPGLPVADAFRVTPKTRTVFVIEKK